MAPRGAAAGPHPWVLTSVEVAGAVGAEEGAGVTLGLRLPAGTAVWNRIEALGQGEQGIHVAGDDLRWEVDPPDGGGRGATAHGPARDESASCTPCRESHKVACDLPLPVVGEEEEQHTP